MTEDRSGQEPADADVPVSELRLHECCRDAHFWARHLPEYADRSQSKADFWAILAGFLAAVTSLSVFPVLGDGAGTLAKTIVSVVALASAVSALVPRVKSYGEQAGSARVLAAQYGSLYGRLLDLVNENPVNQHVAKGVVAEYQAVKEKKDALRGLTHLVQKRDKEKSGSGNA